MSGSNRQQGALVSTLLVLLLAGCSSLTINLPAVTEQPGAERHAGKIIWHDLLTTDIEASKAFYGGLFGWTFEEVPLSLGFGRSSKYLMIRQDGELIGGMVDTARLGASANNSQWVVLMSVSDIDAAVEAVADGGGEVLTPPTDLNERGRLALVRDQAGAVLGLLQTRDGDPPDTSAAYGSFMWNEVWVPDADATEAFYKSIAPFEHLEREMTNGELYRGLGS